MSTIARPNRLTRRDREEDRTAGPLITGKFHFAERAIWHLIQFGLIALPLLFLIALSALASVTLRTRAVTVTAE